MHRPVRVETDFPGGMGTAEILGVSRERAEQLISWVRDSAATLRRRANGNGAAKAARKRATPKRSATFKRAAKATGVASTKSSSQKAASSKNASSKARSSARSKKTTRK